MKTIILPAGETHVNYGELAHLIADALWPVTSADDDRIAYGGARVNLNAKLKQAVQSGALPVKDPLTKLPHTFPVGDALNRALVTVDDLRTFLSGTGVSVELAHAGKPADTKESAITDPCATFRAMDNLTASELSITFVGDKAAEGLGANNMLEITARGQTKRVAFLELDLVNRNNALLNIQGVILLGMTQKKKLPYSPANATKMKRLRDALRSNLGISGDPFEPYQKATGWVPLFKVSDKRGAANERAKRDAELRTDSYEQLTARGLPFSEPEGDDDAGERWLRDNDPDA